MHAHIPYLELGFTQQESEAEHSSNPMPFPVVLPGCASLTRLSIAFCSFLYIYRLLCSCSLCYFSFNPLSMTQQPTTLALSAH